LDSLAWYAQLQFYQMLVLAAGLLILLGSESLAPRRPRQSVAARTAHLVRNGMLWLVTSVTTSVILGGTVLYTAYWLEVQRIGLLHFFATPLWLRVVAGFVALDLADYVFHRMSHDVRWLWLLHAVHHSDEDVDVSTNLRAHPLHVIATTATKLIVLAAIGIPLWVWLLRELVVMPITQLQHAAVRLPARLERLLGYVIVTPAIHQLHHSPRAALNNTNFGGMVPWWDRLFGTYSEPADAPAVEFGLDALREPRWQTVWGMCATPFTARRIDPL
jgi:sterol desaturase/sphingolipid hydroxylase (fatty acid hydroxylase superfamily)